MKDPKTASHLGAQASIVVFSLPQIYEEFYHTVNNADHDKDLRLWSNTHGVNMAMNWPQFEVSGTTEPGRACVIDRLKVHDKKRLDPSGKSFVIRNHHT